MKIDSLPKKDGFCMPAEWAPHDGCIIIFPFRTGSWGYNAKYAKKTFSRVIETVSQSETVYVAACKSHYEEVKKQFSNNANVIVFSAETDDSWARDIAPTFVKNTRTEKVRAVNWSFNAWGGDYDGLYAHWENDDAFAKLFSEKYCYDYYDASPFVLEGGSIHSDGEGTVIVTESCLLSKGRNPNLTKEQIEQKLKEYLGAEKVLWLPRGIFNDETNEHVDNVCAFIRPAEVVLAWTDDETDEQYSLSKADLEYLENVTDAKGRKITVHKLPIPTHPICITKKDLKGYVFEEGEDEREIGERLAASYVNFYFSNNGIILPAFGGKNKASDKLAVSIMTKLCPDRKVFSLPARDILVGGGNIHCITQQIPSKKENNL